MKKIIFALSLGALAGIIQAGESGLFLSAGASLNTMTFHSIYEDNAGTQTHSNTSSNKPGASVRLGYQAFEKSARFGTRYYVEYSNQGYGEYDNEAKEKLELDSYSAGIGADVMFEIASIRGMVLGIYAGSGYFYHSNRLEKTSRPIYIDQVHTDKGAFLSGSGLVYQGGISLTFGGKHRLEFELRGSKMLSDYDSGLRDNVSNTGKERLKLSTDGFIGYRTHYVYVF